jgi:hypothetical protein
LLPARLELDVGFRYKLFPLADFLPDMLSQSLWCAPDDHAALIRKALPHVGRLQQPYDLTV